MKTQAHTLEERYNMQLSLVQELVEEIRDLEDEIMDLKSNNTSYEGIINGEDADDIEVVIVKNLVVAVGNNNHAIIDLTHGNISMFFERDGEPAVVSIWNEEELNSTIASEELMISFKSNDEAKTFYRKVQKVLNQYYFAYQEE